MWAGPGVTTGRGAAAVEETRGFIIDWSSGIITEHPRGLPLFNVIFYVESSDTPVYSVSYQPDFSTGQGYVYLPGPGDQIYARNANTILRGHSLEGHWFRASSEWQEVATSLLAPPTRKN